MIHSFDEFKNIPVDYDSPINIVVNQMASEIAKFTDDGVMQAVVKAGFDIDKDKLVSILQQDRERYQEAYQKGYTDRDSEIVRCKDCIAAHDGKLIYEMWCGITGKRITRDDFCSNGRRKDE